MENLENKLAELEALLFIHGEPLSFKKIAKILDLRDKEVRDLTGELGKRLSAADRGLNLVTDEEKIQLVAKAQFGKILESFVKEELSEELTPASLEVLSLVAYFGPITRNRLEYFRGVNSSFTLRNLLIRGLVERFPDAGNPTTYLYQPSFTFLKHMGLKKREDLPEYEKFRTILEKQPELSESHPNP